MAVYLNPCKLRIVGMTNYTHNKYKTVMEMMLRHKDTFPWERLFSHRFPQAEQAVKASMTRESMRSLLTHGWSKQHISVPPVKLPCD